MNNLKILLGFDFGLKRIGVAIGQMVTLSARPLLTLNAKDGEPQWHEIKKLITKWVPDALVVGIPFNMDGTPQLIGNKALLFVSKLEQQFALPVFTAEERLTTKAAREHLFNAGGFKALAGGQVDAVAAQLILENFIKQYVEKNK